MAYKQSSGSATDTMDMMAAESRHGKARSSYDYYDYNDYGGGAKFSRRQLFDSTKPKNPSPASLDVSASEPYGSFGGHHGYHKECDNGISIGLLLTALLGIGVGFFTLFTKITMITKRRKKRSVGEHLADKGSEGLGVLIEELHDIVYGGRGSLDKRESDHKHQKIC